MFDQEKAEFFRIHENVSGFEREFIQTLIFVYPDCILSSFLSSKHPQVASLVEATDSAVDSLNSKLENMQSVYRVIKLQSGYRLTEKPAQLELDGLLTSLSPDVLFLLSYFLATNSKVFIEDIALFYYNKNMAIAPQSVHPKIFRLREKLEELDLGEILTHTDSSYEFIPGPLYSIQQLTTAIHTLQPNID